MTIKLLYHGPLWHGSTSLQRARAFADLPEVCVIESDSGLRVGGHSSLVQRIRWKLRWPMDVARENETLLQAARLHRPDILMVDNSKVINRATLRNIRQEAGSLLAYYTPDDVMGRHNLSHPLRLSFPDWDVFFTTKAFNVKELNQSGVRNPRLVGKAYDPRLHYPVPRDQFGAEYESFDCVFIGSYERERADTLNAIAESGLSIVLYGADKGGWDGRAIHSGITLRNSVFAEDYCRSWHHGKLAFGFLRKLNRDQITQRTMEIAAMGRPMLAEKTDAHDAHFVEGQEYLGFRNNDEAVTICRRWLNRDQDRIRLGQAARERCLTSGYSTIDRAKQMLQQMLWVRK